MDSAVLNTHQNKMQRPQTNENLNGPRVSFNKDVHVKRIGGRSSNENSNSYALNKSDHPSSPPPPPPPAPPQPQYTRELPSDLTKEDLIKEAQKVIAQTERIKCTVDTPNSLAGIRTSQEDRKFSSLPHRKKKPSKPVTRSASDASQKKPKRGSIFSIFSKRSDPNLSITANPNESTSPSSRTVGKRTPGKPIARSKSDVGYNPSKLTSNTSASNKGSQSQTQAQTHDRKRIKIPDGDELMTKAKKKSQLSPISENPPAEKLFGFTPGERKLLRYTKSEEKNLPPALEPMLSEDDDDDHHRHIDHGKHLLNHSKSTTPTNPSHNHSRSLESLHSSQLPQEKLPLTKGLKIDGMVKRLSMDRFSPPLHFNSPAFSYTRPPSTDNPSIVYAQVRRDEAGDKMKEFPSTIHRSTNLATRERSPVRNLFGSDVVDNVPSSPNQRQTLSTKFLNEKNNAHLNHNNSTSIFRSSPIHFNGDRFITERLSRSPFLHNSEEDEGLGFEHRKLHNDDYLTPTRDISRQSSSEPPIIPTLRPSYGSIERLATRRKLLESKMHERNLDFGYDPNAKPAAKLLAGNGVQHHIPMDQDPELNGIRSFEKFDHHFMDTPKMMAAQPPPRKQWARQPKYYPETDLNDEFLSDMDTLRRERERLRHKSYLSSADRKFNEISPPPQQQQQQQQPQPKSHNDGIIDLGYIDQYNDTKLLNNNNNKIINQNLNYKYRTKGRAPQPEKLVNGNGNGNGNGMHTTYIIPIEMERRKLDKTDSGIEHDFRRNRADILHGDNNNSRYRRFGYLTDNIKNITELFLKRECQFSESLHPSKKRYDFVFRERSIDDGSHFDPHLDKYPEQTKNHHGTLTRKSQQHHDDAKKSDNKFGSLKKQVKELFTRKKSTSPPSNKTEVLPKQNSAETFDTSSPARAIDIATRRRLSTPKASPIPKRIPSQKSSKLSHVSSHRSDASSKPAAAATTTPQKTGWFKSLERLSRKNKSSDVKKPAVTIKRSNTTLTRPTYQRAQSPSPDFKPLSQPNLRFFGDTDLESLSKAATSKRTRAPLNTSNSQSLQNLRSNSRSVTTTTTTSTTTRIDPDSSQNVRGATSMQNLHRDFRSKYLPELSESTSENENMNGDRKPHHAVKMHHSTPNSKHKARRQYNSSEHLAQSKEKKSHESPPNRGWSEKSATMQQRPSRSRERDLYEEHSLYNERNAEELHRSALRERNGRSSSETRHLPPKGPTKPAREAERRRALSNDRFLESSGTEGDSSQQSVVYLHATTIGHIPQPYVGSSKRSSKSREELSSIKSKSSSPIQPQTRTVSRSVSMSAPWAPRHIADGYEINYSQTMENPKKKSTLNRDARSRLNDDTSSQRSSLLAKSSNLRKIK